MPEIEKYNDEVRLQQALQVMEHQIEHHCSVRDACQAVGLAERTFYDWVKKGILTKHLLDVKAARQNALQSQALNAMQSILEYQISLASGEMVVRGGNPTSAAKFVERQAGLSAAELPGAEKPKLPAYIPQFITFVQGTVTAEVEDESVVEGEYEDVP